MEIHHGDKLIVLSPSPHTSQYTKKASYTTFDFFSLLTDVIPVGDDDTINLVALLQIHRPPWHLVDVRHGDGVTAPVGVEIPVNGQSRVGVPVTVPLPGALIEGQVHFRLLGHCMGCIQYADMLF